MSVGRFCRAAVLAVLPPGSLALTPAAASAACPEGAQCATVTVPLDHSARPPGTLPWPTRSCRRPARGPGRSCCSAAAPARRRSRSRATFADAARAAARRAMTSSRSTSAAPATPARSPARSRAPTTSPRARTKLGDRRAFFNTPETAHDLENLRVALGVDKLTLLGVSYGAKVAGEYARRYPASTAALVLDSPTPVDGLDGYDQLRTLGTPRVLKRGLLPRPVRSDRERPGRGADGGRRAAAARRRCAGRWSPLAARSRPRA